jgi:Uma2 family endonuclease
MKAIEIRRWTRSEYERMIATGLFAPGERVELVDGEILTATPQGSLHATSVRLTEDVLRAAFGPGFDVRAQLPLALGSASEPEPDLVVVTGNPRHYRNAHPAGALLVVEVADSTLEFDRQRKGKLYAGAGIDDYWIVNLIDGCVEVHRQPLNGCYCSVRRILPGDRIAPLAVPESMISVADLLP